MEKIKDKTFQNAWKYLSRRFVILRNHNIVF